MVSAGSCLATPTWVDGNSEAVNVTFQRSATVTFTDIGDHQFSTTQVFNKETVLGGVRASSTDGGGGIRFRWAVPEAADGNQLITKFTNAAQNEMRVELKDTTGNHLDPTDQTGWYRVSGTDGDKPTVAVQFYPVDTVRTPAPGEYKAEIIAAIYSD